MIEALFVSALLAVPVPTLQGHFVNRHTHVIDQLGADKSRNRIVDFSDRARVHAAGEMDRDRNAYFMQQSLDFYPAPAADAVNEMNRRHAADDSSTSQVGTMGRYVPEPAGMLGSASLRPVQVEDAGPSQREEQVVHVLLGANAFFSVGSRLYTNRCLGEQTCYERNKITRDLYTNHPTTGIMVQAASTAIENYLLWRIHDNSDKRPWVRAAIVGVLAFNVWNFANDLRVYKQTGRNR